MDRWFWVLGRQNYVLADGVLPVGDNWDAVVASVKRFPFGAPMLARDTIGGEHNEGQNEVLGHVVEWREMSVDVAESLGLEHRGVDALYAKIKAVDDASAARLNKIAYVSPSIELGHTDEAGGHWDAVIHHVAEVAVPLQQVRQPDQRTLADLQMSRGSAGSSRMEDEEIVDVAEDVAEEAVDTVESLAAQIAELRSIIEELVSPKAEDAPEESAPQSVAMSRKAIEKLVASEHAVQARADELARTRQWTGTREQLVAMCRDQGSYAALQKSLAPRAAATPQVGKQTAKAGVAMSRDGKSGPTIDELARAHAREHGVSYSVALRAVGGK